MVSVGKRESRAAYLYITRTFVCGGKSRMRACVDVGTRSLLFGRCESHNIINSQSVRRVECVTALDRERYTNKWRKSFWLYWEHYIQLSVINNFLCWMRWIIHSYFKLLTTPDCDYFGYYCVLFYRIYVCIQEAAINIYSYITLAKKNNNLRSQSANHNSIYNARCIFVRISNYKCDCAHTQLQRAPNPLNSPILPYIYNYTKHT